MSDSEPRISAIIPAFNRERTIGRAVESALAQTHPPAEIIVVDDGSTDNTAAVVAAYGNSVRYLYQDNAGAAAARNRGVESASAPWVAFLDSDDYWFNDHLKRIAAAINATEGAAGFYFSDTITDNGASLWQISDFAAPAAHCLVADATDWVLLNIQPTMLQASVFNRELYRQAGGLWTALRIREDTHLFLVMGIGGLACAVAGSAVRMTADDQSGRRLTHEFESTSADWWIQTRLMYGDVLNRFPELAVKHRRRLRSRLATAYQRLGQQDWHAGRFASAVTNQLRAVHLAPGRMTVSSLRKVCRMIFTAAATRHEVSKSASIGTPSQPRSG